VAQAFLLDLGRCIGCQACVVSCKAGNELDEGTQYIRIIEQTRGVFPNLAGGFDNHRCYHCADAACIAVCPTGALFKEDGLTRLDRGACSGCGYCVESCPYGVPEMVGGRSSKCDACAATTTAGGEPWCVTTCPSRALMYGARDEILAEAGARVAVLRDRYPNAQVYGETQAGGLGVVMVLPDDPEVLGLPASPDPPLVTRAWQRLVQPGSIALTGVTVAAAGVAAVIARRNHLAELEVIEDAEEAAAHAGDTEEV
jgi:formate dehydrogenase iron-sulfur subunit